MADVVIIGGGPAGSAAAIALTGIGMKVRLYEKARFPRAKLCGGFVSAESLADLARLGVLDAVRAAPGIPIHRSRITVPSGAHAEANLPAPALSIARAEFDDLLLNRAADLGVEVIEKAVAVLPEDEAPWMIIASGRQPGQGPWFYGLQASFEDRQPEASTIEIHLVGSGYVGVVQQGTGRINVCALTTRQAFREGDGSPDQALAIWMDQNLRLRARLSGAHRQSRWMSVGPVAMGLRQIARPRRLFSGDAACVVDPFAGEGIAMALRSARLLAQAFSQTGQSVETTYTRAWHHEFDASLRFHRILRQFLERRALQEIAVQGMALFPGVLRWLTRKTRPTYDEISDPRPFPIAAQG